MLDPMHADIVTSTLDLITIYYTIIKNKKRPKSCYTFHSCLGLGKSLEQYKASEALVSWFRAALYCSSDFPTPRKE